MDAMESDQPSGSNLSNGPSLQAVDGVVQVGVHIIRVPNDVAVGQVKGGHVTKDGQAQVAKHVGKPKQRDVIVYAGLPWHMAENELQPHPEVHARFPDSILKLHRAKPHGPESAVWWSEHEFTITTIADEDVHDASDAHPPHTSFVDAVPYPFGEKPRTHREAAMDGTRIFVARSSVPVAAGRYKICFMMEGEQIDPNMHCF
jgi:hypothetical protein